MYTLRKTEQRESQLIRAALYLGIAGPGEKFSLARLVDRLLSIVLAEMDQTQERHGRGWAKTYPDGTPTGETAGIPDFGEGREPAENWIYIGYLTREEFYLWVNHKIFPHQIGENNKNPSS